MTKTQIDWANRRLSNVGLMVITASGFDDRRRRYALVDLHDWCKRNNYSPEAVIQGAQPAPDWYSARILASAAGSAAASAMIDAALAVLDRIGEGA